VVGIAIYILKTKKSAGKNKFSMDKIENGYQALKAMRAARKNRG
jgi:hypothetical protein